MVNDLTSVVSGFSAPSGYTFGKSGTVLTIDNTSNRSFTVEVEAFAAPDTGDQTTSGTPSYYSVADINFSGTPHLGETWSIEITQADGVTTTTHSYVVGDTSPFDGVVDSSGDLVGSDGLNLTDVAEGLKQTIGSIATRNGSVLTLTKAEGIKVNLLPVVAAPVQGSMTGDPANSVRSVTQLDIDLTGVALVGDEVWTLTLDGDEYTYTIPSTPPSDVDAVGDIFATHRRETTPTPQIPSAFDVAYDSSSDVLTVTRSSGEFSGSLTAGAVLVPQTETVGTEWASRRFNLTSAATPIRVGEAWSLTLGSSSADVVTVGTTQLQSTVITTLDPDRRLLRWPEQQQWSEQDQRHGQHERFANQHRYQPHQRQTVRCECFGDRRTGEAGTPWLLLEPVSSVTGAWQISS